VAVHAGAGVGVLYYETLVGAVWAASWCAGVQVSSRVRVVAVVRCQWMQQLSALESQLGAVARLYA
jgi:phosphoribulokinase